LRLHSELPAGKELRLIPGPQNVQRAFEIFGLTTVLHFADRDTR
jgi:hypothetical protein